MTGGDGLPARLSPLDDDGGVDPPADVEPRGQAQEARMRGRRNVIGDLVRHRLVKRAAIAERPDVQLQGFQLHAQPVGDIFELQRREIRLAGFRAQAGELRNLHADGVVALGRRIGKGLEIGSWLEGMGSKRRATWRLLHILRHSPLTRRKSRCFKMRLTKIKLAGFKSFVDPTQVSFPSNLTGVVGPNGCGKSNVIDAVRWVMGELSAKHLRGDNMADVVFNGSTARKPVGTASVELVFDNSDGKIGGAYANYNEMSLKRQVSRDGSSGYFINSRALPPQGHHESLSRHRPRLAQLRDHRAGHDLARHRGEVR